MAPWPTLSYSIREPWPTRRRTPTRLSTRPGSSTSSSTAEPRSWTAPRPASGRVDCSGARDRPGAGVAAMTGTAVTETPAVARLPGGPLAYTLRRSPRSRGLRVVIHPERGVVVTVPASGRRGWRDPERHIDTFLREREPWLRRHLANQARDRAEIAARGGLRDGATIR